MPGFCVGSCCVLLHAQRRSFNFWPDLVTRLTPAFLQALLSWKYVGPGPGPDADIGFAFSLIREVNLTEWEDVEQIGRYGSVSDDGRVFGFIAFVFVFVLASEGWRFVSFVDVIQSFSFVTIVFKEV